MIEKPYRPPEVDVAAFEAIFIVDIWKVQHELDRLRKTAIAHGKSDKAFVAAYQALGAFMEMHFLQGSKKDVA